jgi:hypothetical protein
MFCEFLHAQTTENFAHERLIASCAMGIVSSILAILIIGFMFFISKYAWTLFYMAYVIYALYVFIFSLKKNERCDMPLYGKFILVIFVLVFNLTSSVDFRPTPSKFEGIAFMGAWIVLGYHLVMYSKQTCKWNTTVRGIFSLILRFFYFKILSLASTFSWGNF